MKTAMQELIEWCNQYEGQMISADQVVLHAHKLVEKEKEQIMNAFSRGLGTELSDWENSEQYYDRTYNQNK
jgi:hypothetical protein